MNHFRLRNRYFSWGWMMSVTAFLSFIVITACIGQATAKLTVNIIHKDKSPKEGIVAKIGEREITEEELIGSNKLDLFELEKRKYDIEMENFEKLMVKYLIGPEAKKAEMDLESFISKKITGEIKISKDEFNQFVAEKHIPENQLNPQINDRINGYLQSIKKQEAVTKYLAKITAKNPVELYFQKPKMVMAVDVDQAPVLGSKKAAVTIVEFSDFECPFCSRGADTVNQLKKLYPGKVRVAFKHFPLGMHKDARPTSEASMCVNEQSTEKFWKFHDLAFKNQKALDAASLEKYAKEVGANIKQYNECVSSKKYAEFVQKDLEYGEKLGVKATPTFFVNGQIMSGALSIEQFSEMINEELAEKK